MTPLGIIAGSGQFPAQVARGARAAGRGVVIAGFAGHSDPALADSADAFILLHLGQLGKLLEFFHSHGVTELCMAGAISKPKALDFRPDMKAMKLLFSMRRKGDDALLRTIAAEFAREGFAVVQASSFVPELAAPAGVLTRRSPDAEEWDDIRFGWPVARTMGQLDIGQLIVVKSGIVVAVEAMEGTDATLRRGGELGGAGCTAIKIFKPGQDERLDQPAIGPGTIRVMAEHKYRCLAYEAGKTLLFDRETAVSLADKAGIAVVGLQEDAEEMPPAAEGERGTFL